MIHTYTAIKSCRGKQPVKKVMGLNQFDAAERVWAEYGWLCFNLYNEQGNRLLSRFDLRSKEIAE